VTSRRVTNTYPHVLVLHGRCTAKCLGNRQTPSPQHRQGLWHQIRNAL
jgi:hypothetical protein